MGLLDMTSRNSLWRGHDYYEENRVKERTKLSEHEYEGIINGNSQDYEVFIDTEHPKRSVCSCPHASEKSVICKHMVALYFSVFPKEASILIQEARKYEEQEEKRLKKLHQDTHKYINRLSKKELVEQLECILNIAPDWVYDRFVRDNDIGYL